MFSVHLKLNFWTFGSNFELLDQLLNFWINFWILRENFEFEIQILNFKVKFWSSGSNFEVKVLMLNLRIKILNFKVKFWTLELKFEFFSIFELHNQLLNKTGSKFELHGQVWAFLTTICH